MIPAVEPRIKINVLNVAGLSFERAKPEVDPINSFAGSGYLP